MYAPLSIPPFPSSSFPSSLSPFHHFSLFEERSEPICTPLCPFASPFPLVHLRYPSALTISFPSHFSLSNILAVFFLLSVNFTRADLNHASIHSISERYSCTVCINVNTMYIHTYNHKLFTHTRHERAHHKYFFTLKPFCVNIVG